MIVEQIMTDQLKKTGAQATLARADDPGYHHPAVVVGDPLGNASKELKRPNMTFPERLGAFTIKRHHEKRI